jgi:hypothetical protein
MPGFSDSFVIRDLSTGASPAISRPHIGQSLILQFGEWQRGPVIERLAALLASKHLQQHQNDDDH